tara:strand:- start:2288 stop:3619 length:1332 start_codon:yes stop_codon:yes gene_type:complete
MLKNIKIEILIIAVLFLNVFVSYNLDLGFYNYFSYFKDSLQKIYLKKFFEDITILGDSLWYFLISIFLIVLCYFLPKKVSLKKYNNFLNKINNFGLFLFFAVLLSGILTQIIKHVLGRPRPNSTNFDGSFGLNFFTFDSNLHSFPSGHTATIFSAALVFAFFVPKLKLVFYFLALIISFSRVVVGAHFITDVVAGIAVAFIGYKVSKYILSKYLKLDQKYFLGLYNNYFHLVLMCLVLFGVILSIAPTFDIAFSSLFYYGDKQFLIQSYYIITIFFRKIILFLIIIYILFLPIISLVVPMKKIYFDHQFNIKEIIYIWGSMLLSLVVLINLFLKNMWGRARPGEILELGGKNFFTPWYKISSQCDSNCSFVSGDAAVGFSLLVLYLLIKKDVFLWMAVFFGTSIGLIRIMEGGHFFSDVVFSGLVVFLFNLFLHSYYKKRINE